MFVVRRGTIVTLVSVKAPEVTYNALELDVFRLMIVEENKS